MLEIGKKLFTTGLGRLILICAFTMLGLWVFGRGCSGPTESKTGGADATMAGNSDNTLDPLGLPAPINGFQESLPAAGQYRVLVESYGDRVTKTESELTAARTEIQDLKTQLANTRESGRSSYLRIDQVLRELKESASSASLADVPIPPSPSDDLARRPRGTYNTEGAIGAASRGHGLEIIRFGPAEDLKEKADKEPRAVHIPAGSTAQAVITNGVFAPTTGEPSPVRLFLQTDLRGPNGTRIPLGEAFMIGKAVGEANSMRVTIEVDRMSLVTSTGKSHDARILAYVVGHDGLEGVPGEYHWRAGELLPLAAVASGLTAAAGALAAAETVTSVSPIGGATEFLTGSASRYAAFQGTAGGSKKLEEMVVERMREIRPAIAIAPYRRVTVVFLESVTLENLDPAEIEEGNTHARFKNPFTGLDLHR